MQKINFSISINAPKEKVWETLWDDSSYPKWTSVFCEGSHAVTDWKEGSKVLFLGSDGSGMTSIVAVNKPNEFMSFKHLGVVKKGTEDTESEQVKAWAGALENYTLTEAVATTKLEVEMDMDEKMKGFFIETFPKALQQVKTLSENQ